MLPERNAAEPTLIVVRSRPAAARAPPPPAPRHRPRPATGRGVHRKQTSVPLAPPAPDHTA